MIHFEGVSFAYAGSSTITDVNLHIPRGAFVAVLGANGAGKTTLAKMTNGLFKPGKGNVTVDSMNTRTTKTSVLAKKIGFLFQNPDRLICKTTVRDEVMFSLSCVSDDLEYCQRRLGETLDMFRLDPERNPWSLSRGERQMLALASILAAEPQVLVLDEPTTGLAFRECMDIMDIIARLNREGVTVLMVTHDMELALDFAESAVVLSGGRVLRHAPVRTVLKDEALLSKARLLPPQIAGVALRLPGFDEVYTVPEMVSRIEEARL
jgi:energy-coupling factor transport system ATP-binding protein